MRGVAESGGVGVKNGVVFVIAWLIVGLPALYALAALCAYLATRLGA